MFNGGRNSWDFFSEYLIEDCIIRAFFEKWFSKAFGISEGLVIILVSHMEEGEECDTILQEIKILILFQGVC